MEWEAGCRASVREQREWDVVDQTSSLSNAAKNFVVLKHEEKVTTNRSTVGRNEAEDDVERERGFSDGATRNLLHLRGCVESMTWSQKKKV